MSEANVDVIKSAYDNFARGDIDAVLNLFDPQIEWIEPDVPGLPFRGAHRGPQAVAQEVFAVAGEFDDFRSDAIEYIDAGDTVVVRSHFTGRGKSTGRELDSDSVQLFTLHDGKVARHQAYHDTASWLAALGGSA